MSPHKWMAAQANVFDATGVCAAERTGHQCGSLGGPPGVLPSEEASTKAAASSPSIWRWLDQRAGGQAGAPGAGLGTVRQAGVGSAGWQQGPGGGAVHGDCVCICILLVWLLGLTGHYSRGTWVKGTSTTAWLLRTACESAVVSSRKRDLKGAHVHVVVWIWNMPVYQRLGTWLVAPLGVAETLGEGLALEALALGGLLPSADSWAQLFLSSASGSRECSSHGRCALCLAWSWDLPGATRSHQSVSPCWVWVQSVGWRGCGTPHNLSPLPPASERPSCSAQLPLHPSVQGRMPRHIGTPVRQEVSRAPPSFALRFSLACVLGVAVPAKGPRLSAAAYLGCPYLFPTCVLHLSAGKRPAQVLPHLQGPLPEPQCLEVTDAAGAQPGLPSQ